MKFLFSLFLLIPLGGPALVLLASLVSSQHRWADILVQFAAPALVGAVILLITYLLLLDLVLSSTFWRQARTGQDVRRRAGHHCICCVRTRRGLCLSRSGCVRWRPC